MEAIDLVREHFAALGTRSIEIPEWKLTIYSTPVTLAEKNRLYRKAKESDMELLVDVLILKATDKDGNKLFNADHKMTLLHKADSNLIARAANFILSEAAPSVDELKNSRTAARLPISSPSMLSRKSSASLRTRFSPCRQMS